ncbi:MAG: hypothetical protein HY820_02435 [Acidobacteria bacterium]|nr:hypothetical protein [Acidobacteriota bacterium]
MNAGYWDLLALFEAFLGTGLSLFLSIVLYPQRNVRPAGRPIWMMMVAFGIWHFTVFFIRFHPASMGHEIEYAAVWKAFAYPSIAAGMVAAAWIIRLAWRAGERWLAAVQLASCLGALYYLPVPYLTITPPFFLACFLYARSPFGLLISRRSLFALGLGIFAAIYLTSVRAIALGLENEFGAVGWLAEVALVLWAGILWLPLYAWMSRFLSRRAALINEFAKSIIQDAALILEIDKRLDYFAHRLTNRLGIKRVILSYGGRIAQTGMGGVTTEQIQPLLTYLETTPTDFLYFPRLSHSPARTVLESLRCDYCFPLRYENCVSGALLLDTRPHVHLDDNEEILLALTPQISQSIETCRLLAERMGLEHMASLGKMSATIAHEIKNPLSAIKAIAQLMQEDPAITEQYGEDLRFITSETDRLDRSLRQLLGFSRPTPLLADKVDLSELVRSTVTALQRQAAAEGIQLDARIQPAVEHEPSNRELWQQVVLNLVLNAIQATPRGSTVTVTVDAARFSVEDQGPGISPELRERVFDPFFTTKQKGTGLGLAIVRRNVQAFGGDVQIECPPTGGTRITVTW